MRMLMLGAASLALAASGALADPGKGGGGGGHGGGNGGDHAAAPNPGHGGGKGGGNGGGGDARGNSGHGGGDARGNGNGGSHGQGGGMKAEHAPAAPQRGMQAERPSHGNGKAMHQAAEQRSNAREDRGHGNGNARRGGDVREVRQVARDDRRDGGVIRDGRGARVVQTVVHFGSDAPRGLINGCPPGLAKKNNGCMPPGLAQQRDQRYYRPSWFGYPSLGDGRYYYDNGYLYRTNNTGSVLGYIPLLGGALSVGNPWPSYYDPYPVPDYYVDYYNLGAPNSYRYADDVLYRVDPRNDAITSIAALLTGDQFNIGQRMPAGYDVYNVPYAYRDRYYDTPEYDYRYADGYIYQVDPTTQLIQAAIQLLT